MFPMFGKAPFAYQQVRGLILLFFFAPKFIDLFCSITMCAVSPKTGCFSSFWALGELRASNRFARFSTLLGIAFALILLAAVQFSFGAIQFSFGSCPILRLSKGGKREGASVAKWTKKVFSFLPINGAIGNCEIAIVSKVVFCFSCSAKKEFPNASGTIKKEAFKVIVQYVFHFQQQPMVYAFSGNVVESMAHSPVVYL